MTVGSSSIIKWSVFIFFIGRLIKLSKFEYIAVLHNYY